MLNHVSKFDTPEGYYRARLDALRRVATEWFFWLDSDDELTDEAEAAVDEGMRSGMPLAYTDEIVREAGRPDRRVSREAYDQGKHMSSALFTHHLSLFRTDAAIAAAREMPETGELQPNVLLPFLVARGSAAHIPRAAYVWNKGQGLHRNARFVIAQTRSLIWCRGHA